MSPIKTWKADQDSSTGIQISDSSIQATVHTVNGPNGVFVDESGLYLRGKFSMMTSPEDIRVGGIWMQPSGWQQMFPSTMAFPNPNLILSPPLQGISKMTQAVSWMMSLLL